ncbi:MAG TPA: L,D-transpeptidase [Pseudonocardia sp.]|jgi:hypothetical protein
MRISRSAGPRAARPRRPLRALACAAITGLLVTVPFAGAAHADSGKVAGTPCSVGAKACVQLGHSGYNARAWFIENGKVVRGPVAAVTGGPGSDTPTGTFSVLSKDLHHVSTETNNAEGSASPMPYSVFFTKSGVAFHGGGSMATRTAGCVRMANANASYFFSHLSPGDTVQVVSAGADSAPSRRSGGHHGGGGGGGLLGF